MKTIFQVAARAWSEGAVAFTHQVSTERGYIKTDYLAGFMSVDSTAQGKPVVVIDGDYDLGGRLEIPAETKVKINDEGVVEFRHGDCVHMLTFYQNIPMHFV